MYIAAAIRWSLVRFRVAGFVIDSRVCNEFWKLSDSDATKLACNLQGSSEGVRRRLQGLFREHGGESGKSARAVSAGFVELAGARAEARDSCKDWLSLWGDDVGSLAI